MTGHWGGGGSSLGAYLMEAGDVVSVLTPETAGLNESLMASLSHLNTGQRNEGEGPPKYSWRLAAALLSRLQRPDWTASPV